MIPDMNLEDKIKLVFFIPLGFIFGVLLSAVVTFASLTSWFVLVFFFLVVIGFLVFEKISDAANLRTMEALSDRSDEELREIRDCGELCEFDQFLELLEGYLDLGGDLKDFCEG